MWWALFWAVIFGGSANSGWAAAFGFMLSLWWQESSMFENKLTKLWNTNRELQEDNDRLRRE